MAHSSTEAYAAFTGSLTPEQAATWVNLAPAARLAPVTVRISAQSDHPFR
jgi:hypothetical protein